MKKLILAAALLAPLSGAALAGDYVGTPERDVINQAPLSRSITQHHSRPDVAADEAAAAAGQPFTPTFQHND